VVLLTHPRNLREADVQAGARRASPRDRLFAVTLDEEGAAIVSEIRHGSPVKLRQFHVDYTPSIATPPPRPALPAEPLAPWTGDVEPVPFPFRFGTSGAVAKFEFDHDGQWLLTVSADGMLHLWGLNGDHREVVPRPFFQGRLLRDVTSVLGVKGGFVLYAIHGNSVHIAHYDCLRRKCRALYVGSGTSVLRTQYLVDVHALRTLISGRPHQEAHSHILDLATGEPLTAAAFAARPGIQKAFEALDRVPDRGSGAIWSSASDLCVSALPDSQWHFRLVLETGTIAFHQVGVNGIAFVPLSDGKALLKNASVLAAHAGGNVLGLIARLSDGTIRLMLFRGPDGATLREHSVKKNSRFLLSRDGRWLAMERGSRILVEKIDTPSEGIVTRCGGYSGEVRLYLGERSLLIVMGQGATHRHLVRWSGPTIEFQYEHKKLGQEGFHTLGFQEVLPKAPSTRLSYDPQRFPVATERDGLGFAIDRYGQIAVFSEMGNTLLCMFMAFRDRLAAWLPDGSRCGSEALGLGPETPGARATLAQVLQGAGGTLKFTSARNHGGLGC
jgi:WD40 repeat protein